MVAELLRHPASAATGAESPHGPLDGLCHPSGGQRLRRLQPGGEQGRSLHAAHVDPVLVPAGQHNGGSPGNGPRSHAARGLGVAVTVVALRYIVDLHQSIHVAHGPGLPEVVKTPSGCGGIGLAGIGQLADVAGRWSLDDGGMEIRIVLEVVEPPAGRLWVVCGPGQGQHPGSGREISFTGWLGLLRALYEVTAAAGPGSSAGP